MKRHIPLAHYKAKFVGLVVILLLIGIQIRSYINFPDSFKLREGFFFGISLGFFLIFFSNEKIEKEEFAFIRLKAFALSFIISFFLIQFVSLAFPFFEIKSDFISANEFVILVLIIAIAIFYYLKGKAK